MAFGMEMFEFKIEQIELEMSGILNSMGVLLSFEWGREVIDFPCTFCALKA
jgi:hypothetical protein